MEYFNLKKSLEILKINQTELAYLLSVNPRTVRRWLGTPTEVPSTARKAINAWVRLERYGLAWRPDGLDYLSPEVLAEQIMLYREHAIHLKDIIDRVTLRGGPTLPWDVNLKERKATVNSILVWFHKLANGGFSPSMYSRLDSLEPDIERDRYLIEDATACYALASAKQGGKK